MDTVVAPPYDVLDAPARDSLLAASPYNVVHVDLNPQGHATAAALYRHWLGSGVLRQDAEAAFYLYTQEFDYQGPRRRSGVIGALHLEPFASGVVRPHERTFAHHKQDRLDLTKEVRANVSPIFGLFSNRDFTLEPPGGWQTPADIDVHYEGVRHRLWTLKESPVIASIERAVRDRTVFIADGHHRYETALNYFALTNPGATLSASADAPDDAQAPNAHVMAFLASFEDPGMVILPTHRQLVSSGGADHRRVQELLSAEFELERFPRTTSGRRNLLERLARALGVSTSIAVSLRDLDDDLLVTLKPSAQAASAAERLDVSVLHERILDGVLAASGAGKIELAYTVDASKLLDRVAAKDTEGAFLLNPTRSEELEAVCMAGQLMPHKSTYFYPKLLTGLLFHAL